MPYVSQLPLQTRSQSLETLPFLFTHVTGGVREELPSRGHRLAGCNAPGMAALACWSLSREQTQGTPSCSRGGGQEAAHTDSREMQAPCQAPQAPPPGSSARLTLSGRIREEDDIGRQEGSMPGVPRTSGVDTRAEEGGDRTTRSVPEALHKTQLQHMLSGECQGHGEGRQVRAAAAWARPVLHPTPRTDPGRPLPSGATPPWTEGGQGAREGAGPVLTPALQG